jgi:hypothetical protein
LGGLNQRFLSREKSFYERNWKDKRSCEKEKIKISKMVMKVKGKQGKKKRKLGEFQLHEKNG